jgi:hypothetical protein
MKKIGVLFYGYKSKELLTAINNTILNQSGENAITVYVIDQINISRSEKINNVSYRHIKWDSLDSPYEYLDEILAISKDDYFMYVNGALEFTDNWDKNFIKMSQDNSVVSGNVDIKFNDDVYKFYPSYNKVPISENKEVSWINKDFLFASTKLFKNFPSLSKIKYLGFEEIVSLYLNLNFIKIFAVKSDAVIRLDSGIESHDYLPFSLKHGYNKVLDIFKKNINVFFNDSNSAESLSLKVGYDFKRLSYLPFNPDDPTYSLKMQLDLIGESRFHSVLKSIY